MDATAVLTGQMWSSNNSEQTKCDQLTVGESTSVHFCLKKKSPHSGLHPNSPFYSLALHATTAL